MSQAYYSIETINLDLGIVAEFRKYSNEAKNYLASDGTGTGWASPELEEDLVNFSRRYPVILFCLMASDDEENYWKTYVKNGKSVELSGAVVYPKFHAEMFEKEEGYSPELGPNQEW